MSHTFPTPFSEGEHEANAKPHIPDDRRIILEKINRVALLLREEWSEVEQGQCPIWTNYLSNPNKL